MTPEAQRIAIAEACRWKLKYDETFPPCWDVILPSGEPHSGTLYARKEDAISKLPDYLNDLNAMAQAEDAVMTGDELDGGSLRYVYAGNVYNVAVPLGQQPFRATATQRAEAFLKTLGLWTDSDKGA